MLVHVTTAAPLRVIVSVRPAALAAYAEECCRDYIRVLDDASISLDEKIERLLVPVEPEAGRCGAAVGSAVFENMRESLPANSIIPDKDRRRPAGQVLRRARRR